MSNLLRPFPLGGVFGNSGYSKWHPNLIAWMQEVYRAVSGDYNVIHLTKDTADSIGGVTGTKTCIAWGEEAKKQPGFTHDVDANNSRVYVENTGRYILTSNVVAVNNSLEYLVMRMYPKINGSTEKLEGVSYSYVVGWLPRVCLQINTELALDQGDYIQIEAHVVASSGQAVTVREAECELIVRRIA